MRRSCRRIFEVEQGDRDPECESHAELKEDQDGIAYVKHGDQGAANQANLGKA